MDASENQWLVFFGKKPAASIRLFCFHCAGGSASAYRSWGSLLPDEVELVGVQLPGREGRYAEKFITSFEDLVEQLVDAMAPYLDKPYAVFGHSLGSLKSYEWIRACDARGLPAPKLFIAAGRRAPHLKETDPPIADLPDDQFIQELMKEYADNLGEVVQHPELREVFLPQLRADFKLSENYRFREGQKVGCPIVSFGGSEEFKLCDEGMKGWAKHTDSFVGARRFPGDHFFIHQSEDEVVSEIGRHLEAMIYDSRSSQFS